MSGPSKPAGHAFISYVREDSDRVDRLQRTLEAAGIPVWRDTERLWPGEDWRARIRRAITDDALAFVACFSRQSLDRERSYQNDEFLLAIEQLRLRRPDDPWLIPVRFDDCEIPDRDLGGGRTLASIQRADLFGDKSDEAAAQLVAAIQRILDRNPRTVAGISAGPKPSRLVAVNVTIAEPDGTDSGFHQPVRSVVYVQAAEHITDLTACYVTDQSLGGTTSLGHAPFHISTRVWRIRSEFLLRSVRDVIIGYTTVTAGHKVQWFQWDGYDHEYDWGARAADGSHLSALLQIREMTRSGEGALTQPVRRGRSEPLHDLPTRLHGAERDEPPYLRRQGRLDLAAMSKEPRRKAHAPEEQVKDTATVEEGLSEGGGLAKPHARPSTGYRYEHYDPRSPFLLAQMAAETRPRVGLEPPRQPDTTQPNS